MHILHWKCSIPSFTRFVALGSCVQHYACQTSGIITSAPFTHSYSHSFSPSTINSNLTFGLSPVVSNSNTPKRLSPCHCRWMGMSVAGWGIYSRVQGWWKNDRGEVENSMTDELRWGDVGGGGNNVVAIAQGKSRGNPIEEGTKRLPCSCRSPEMTTAPPEDHNISRISSRSSR